MLLELVIENLAVIDRVRVQFHPGFTVLTGETGSGKSIVVDALGLLFGARASTDMLRSGTDRARVSGIFEAPPAALPVLEAAGAGIEDGELLIEREILAGGKSRVFVGSRPATAALLRDLAPHLGDIHGQHDQQQLFSSAAQLEILDEFAGTPPLLSELAGVFAEYRATARELEEIEKIEQEKLRLLDLWTFQSSEIAAARLTPDEDAALENERRVLQNVARLSENANTAYAALYDAPESAYAQIRQARRRLDELVRIDGSLAALLDTLRAAEIAVDDASGSLRDYLGRLEADPQRLELVESRLAIIDRLKRKYGAAIEDILRFQGEVVAQIQAAESTSERRAAVGKKRSALAALYEELAAKLSSRREQAARRLEKRVEAELKQLAMERTRFQVRLGRGEWSARGLDEVAFLVSPNLGEEPRALEKIASGGELSRIALALKTCVAGLQRPPKAAARTLVFDEVDAGIGGSAAESVGRRLQQLAASDQVLCVTHLAQIAGFAGRHYGVEKRESKGRTIAVVEELSGETRTREIGRMLSGQRVTPEALKHAEQLIRMSAARP